MREKVDVGPELGASRRCARKEEADVARGRFEFERYE